MGRQEVSSDPCGTAGSCIPRPQAAPDTDTSDTETQTQSHKLSGTQRRCLPENLSRYGKKYVRIGELSELTISSLSV